MAVKVSDLDKSGPTIRLSYRGIDVTPGSTVVSYPENLLKDCYISPFDRCCVITPDANVSIFCARRLAFAALASATTSPPCRQAGVASPPSAAAVVCFGSSAALPVLDRFASL